MRFVAIAINVVATLGLAADIARAEPSKDPSPTVSTTSRRSSRRRPARQDFTKRAEMIPMRDGVKLHTRHLHSEGREERADPDGSHARTTSRSTSRTSPSDQSPASRLHPRVPGHARQVRLGRQLHRHHAGARSAESGSRRSFDRHLGHDRLAGEERPRVERPGRHDRLVVRRLHHRDGVARSASGAQGGGAAGSGDRRVDGRRLVPLRRVPQHDARLHPHADRAARRGRDHAERTYSTSTRSSCAPARPATTSAPTASTSCRGSRARWRIPPTTRTGRRRHSTSCSSRVPRRCRHCGPRACGTRKTCGARITRGARCKAAGHEANNWLVLGPWNHIQATDERRRRSDR